jgi:hypothetical protein
MMEHEGDKTDGTKKQKKLGSPPPSRPNKTRNLERYCLAWDQLGDDVRDRTGAIDTELGKPDSIPLPDERQGITDELEAESHMLVLEHNKNNSNAKCRALKCLVKEQPGQYDEKIRSPYRLNLQATRPSHAHWSQLEKPNRRFFHVSCFQAIGVDIANHMTFPPERVVSSTLGGVAISHTTFHPAIVDWVTNKGKAFDVGLYGEYDDALEAYQTQLDHLDIAHIRTCSGGKCTCGLPPVKPKSSDFLHGEPFTCSLADVLPAVDCRSPHAAPTARTDLSARNTEEVPASPKAASEAAEQKETEDEGEEAKEIGCGSGAR